MKIKEILAKPNVQIVDVRESLEFFFGHVKGSVNIPLSKLDRKMNDFKAMNGPIILVCASGNRSGQAMSFLKSKGIKDVYNGGGWHDVKQLLKASA
ncbi:MAG: rhodanese-like domain-containing protein [Saprospiraceae bacterium]|nr:rhodanese-like domain-containing protein [Saprospiraceae bacterium]